MDSTEARRRWSPPTLAKVLSFRTSLAEAERIGAAALRRGQSVSGFACEMLLRAAELIERGSDPEDA